MAKKKKKINILNVIPHPRSHISSYITEEGKVNLGLRRFKYKWMDIFLTKKMSNEIKVPLDSYGSEVWKLMDGKRTVSQIILELANIFEYEKGYDLRIITYLTQLQHDKLIYFSVPKELE